LGSTPAASANASRIPPSLRSAVDGYWLRGASRVAIASLGEGSPLTAIASLSWVIGHLFKRSEPVDQSTHHSASARLPFVRRRRSRVQCQHGAGAHLHAMQEVRRGLECGALRSASGLRGSAVQRLALIGGRRRVGVGSQGATGVRPRTSRS
jgi:hypothetical protein